MNAGFFTYILSYNNESSPGRSLLKGLFQFALRNLFDFNQPSMLIGNLTVLDRLYVRV
jgi:hypothetical protein